MKMLCAGVEALTANKIEIDEKIARIFEDFQN